MSGLWLWALALAWPLPAPAAVVSVGQYQEPSQSLAEEACVSRCEEPTTWLRAGPGERNLVVVMHDAGAVLFIDAGSPLSAGAGCAATLEGVVSCPRTPNVVVDTGDGDDRITALEVPGLYRGGDGDDVVVGVGSVVGGNGDDIVTAVGDDPSRAATGLFTVRVIGGTGHDVLSAIEGLQPLGAGQGPADVLMLGGDGGDVIVTGNGATRVFAGEGDDRIYGGAGQSWVFAGSGDDDVRGSNYVKGEGGDDRLHGTAGYDRLRGGPGEDFISGSAGRDDIRTDAGKDRVSAVDGSRDRIDCGGVGDHLRVDPVDRLTNCGRR